MKTKPATDFRNVVFECGQMIAYARRSSSGRIYLQQATVESIDITVVANQLCVASLVARKPNGKSQRLHRFDGVVVIGISYREAK